MRVKLSQIVLRAGSEKPVVERWRDLGFLRGLKEGGVIERRCALSYQKLTEYLSSDDTPYVGKYLEAWLYAFLRELLTTKNRINRIIEPRELIDVVNRLTIRDVICCLNENHYKIKQSLINLIEHKGLWDKGVIEVLGRINKDSDYKLYNSITESDIEAQLSKYIAIAAKETLNNEATHIE